VYICAYVKFPVIFATWVGRELRRWKSSSVSTRLAEARLAAILSAFTLLGSTDVPRWSAQRMSTWKHNIGDIAVLCLFHLLSAEYVCSFAKKLKRMRVLSLLHIAHLSRASIKPSCDLVHNWVFHGTGSILSTVHDACQDYARLVVRRDVCKKRLSSVSAYILALSTCQRCLCTVLVFRRWHFAASLLKADLSLKQRTALMSDIHTCTIWGTQGAVSLQPRMQSKCYCRSCNLSTHYVFWFALPIANTAEWENVALKLQFLEWGEVISLIPLFLISVFLSNFSIFLFPWSSQMLSLLSLI